MFLAPGAKLDKYEVIAPLAVGGMAELYVARVSFEKLCVIKRILSQLARDEELVQMFLDEARLAATLHHPNVIQVYDIGIADGRHYVAMEYVHGQDLAAIIATARNQRRGMKLEHSIALVVAAAAGLHHAHEQIGPTGAPLDIVHRDVSPTNILVSYDGNIKVADFGIAKAAARATQTTVGGVKGKLSYMSPEQVRGDRSLDRRSDIFSLGIVLYELTTGDPLSRGDSEYMVAEQILQARIIPPREVRPQYPEQLQDIVMKALALDPADRFATARDLQLALEEFARARQLRLSSVGLAEYMSSLFPSQVGGWDLARRNGQSLIEYVTSMMATKLTGSQITRRDDTSWWRRWAPAVALLAVVAAVAGWVVVFSRSDKPQQPAASAPAPASPPSTAGAAPPPTAGAVAPAPPPLSAPPSTNVEQTADAAVEPARKPSRLVRPAPPPTTPPPSTP